MPQDLTAGVPDLWPQIRAAYCDTDEPVAAICRRFAVRSAALYGHVKRDGWPKRTARPGYVSPFAARDAPAPDGTAQPSPPAPRLAGKAPPSAKRAPARRLKRERSRTELAQRLYDALDLKLTQLETLMANESETTTVDQGRQTRAISALIKAFERVTEYDPELLNSTTLAGLAERGPFGASAAAHVAPAARTAHDAAVGDAFHAGAAEQLRRDIALRIERLVAKRNTPRDPGGA